MRLGEINSRTIDLKVPHRSAKGVKNEKGRKEEKRTIRKDSRDSAATVNGRTEFRHQECEKENGASLRTKKREHGRRK